MDKLTHKALYDAATAFCDVSDADVSRYLDGARHVLDSHGRDANGKTFLGQLDRALVFDAYAHGAPALTLFYGELTAAAMIRAFGALVLREVVRGRPRPD